MRFWAMRNARMIVAAAALLERLAGVSIVAGRYADTSPARRSRVVHRRIKSVLVIWKGVLIPVKQSYWKHVQNASFIILSYEPQSETRHVPWSQV